MIHWLVQSTAAHPDLANSRPPVGLLSAAEQTRFDALRTPKRRHDWLLGRWTAKRLLQGFLWQTTGQAPALANLEIMNDEDGSPYVELHGADAQDSGASDDHRQRLSVCLTISHCEDRSLCAVTALAGRPTVTGMAAPGQTPLAIGADIERVRPRAWSFVETFFTEAEARQVRAAPAAWRDTLVTAIWSAKEAALKVVKLGLTVDTRRVDCAFDLDQPPGSAWRPLKLSYQAAVTGASEIMPCWCAMRDGFVLTLAHSQHTAHLWPEDMKA